jgi:hypothetical protein
MALNPNHSFEDLEEVKCAIAEKNCTPQRVDFLKKLLEHNGFTVVVVKSPPPKATKPAAPASPDAAPVEAPPPPPETFTVGVTDVTFSPTNAVFNRELKTPEGQVVTSAYWKQLEATPKKDEWYWKR